MKRSLLAILTLSLASAISATASADGTSISGAMSGGRFLRVTALGGVYESGNGARMFSPGRSTTFFPATASPPGSGMHLTPNASVTTAQTRTTMVARQNALAVVDKQGQAVLPPHTPQMKAYIAEHTRSAMYNDKNHVPLSAAAEHLAAANGSNQLGQLYLGRGNNAAAAKAFKAAAGSYYSSVIQLTIAADDPANIVSRERLKAQAAQAYTSSKQFELKAAALTTP